MHRSGRSGSPSSADVFFIRRVIVVRVHGGLDALDLTDYDWIFFDVVGGELLWVGWLR